MPFGESLMATSKIMSEAYLMTDGSAEEAADEEIPETVSVRKKRRTSVSELSQRNDGCKVVVVTPLFFVPTIRTGTG